METRLPTWSLSEGWKQSVECREKSFPKYIGLMPNSLRYCIRRRLLLCTNLDQSRCPVVFCSSFLSSTRTSCLRNLLNRDSVKQPGINVNTAMELPAVCGENVSTSQCCRRPRGVLLSAKLHLHLQVRAPPFSWSKLHLQVKTPPSSIAISFR